MRPLSATERAAFIAHVDELVANAPEPAVEVPVEEVETEVSAEDAPTNASEEAETPAE